MSNLLTVLTPYGATEVKAEATLTLPGIGGSLHVGVNAELLRMFETHPARAVEQSTGVPFAVYQEWVLAEGLLQCCGTTTSGRRCRGLAWSLGRIGSPKAWADHPGGYCFTHDPR